MAKKKNIHAQVSQEDSTQVQLLLENYHEIAANLQKGVDQKQAEATLTEITNTSEATQLALLKALAKEKHTDAANVLIAINELSPAKSIRKEARRSLIQLEGAKIYPDWSPPGANVPVIQFTSNPPRFWKGIVTDSFEHGEAQLLLLWEMGEDYSQVRVLGFLLEFWHDGIKDFFTSIQSKRQVEKLIAEMAATAPDLKTIACTLADGRRLIQEALEVNKQKGTAPAKDYRTNLPLVKEWVLEATDLGEDRGLSFFNRDLEPEEVVTTFVEALASDDYGSAYDLLMSDSRLRADLSRDEWIGRHQAWAEEAEPENFKPEFIHEIDQKQGGLWLPALFKASRSTTHKEFDTGWSLIMTDTPLNETIPELPMATAINNDTERHWFWASYTVVREENRWRISSMTDEGADAQYLSIEELQKRIAELNGAVDKITREHQPTDPDAGQYFEEIYRLSVQAMHYYDALLLKLPLDRSIYEEAAVRTLALKQLERSLIYFEPLARRFREKREENLRILASIQMQLSESYFEDEEDAMAEELEELAEANLRESLAIDDNYLGHLLLAELLQEDDDRLAEAEEHLQQAKALTTDENVEATIEHTWGKLAMEQEEYNSALRHFQRFAEIDPANADAWHHIAEAHNMLGNYEEAEANYRRFIGLQPDDDSGYIDLSRMLMENGQPSKAREVLEEGLQANPDSAKLRAYMALVLSELGEHRRAEVLLDEAERIDPDLEMVQVYRQILNLNKTKQLPGLSKSNKPVRLHKRKKR